MEKCWNFTSQLNSSYCAGLTGTVKKTEQCESSLNTQQYRELREVSWKTGAVHSKQLLILKIQQQCHQDAFFSHPAFFVLFFFLISMQSGSAFLCAFHNTKTIWLDPEAWACVDSTWMMWNTQSLELPGDYAASKYNSFCRIVILKTTYY